MKRKALALAAFGIAALLTAPAFASSSPPTATLDSTLARATFDANKVYAEKIAPNVTAKKAESYAQTDIANTTARNAGKTSSGVTNVGKVGGGDSYSTARGSTCIAANNGDSATTGMLASTSPPALGFTREDLAAGVDVTTAKKIGSA